MSLRLKRKEHPQLKTERGSIQIIPGMAFILFLGILLTIRLQMYAFSAGSDYLEDALAASNLASAVPDPMHFSEDNELIIADPVAAYEKYLEAVRFNLSLDENWECGNRTLISGTVRIMDYRVYNVQDECVTEYIIDDRGINAIYSGCIGQVYTPKGDMIEHSGVYSEISFPVEGLFGICVMARKSKLVDIVDTYNNVNGE